MEEIDHLATGGSARKDLAAKVAELLSTDEPDRAADLVVMIESVVAPVSGGLAIDAPAVVAAVTAGISQMSAATRPEALLLLTQVVGSTDTVDSPAGAEVRRRVEASLPMLIALIERGTEAEVAQGIDLVSLGSALSRDAADRAKIFLARIAASSDGPIRASAERELAEVNQATS
jgi:hypothetical protein